MFSRVNEKGEILHPDLVQPELDVPEAGGNSAISHAIIRMREPPSSEAWEDVRTVFASLLTQVETLTGELTTLKRERARALVVDASSSHRDADGEADVHVTVSGSGGRGSGNGGGGGGGGSSSARRASVAVAASMLSNPIFSRPRRVFDQAMAPTAGVATPPHEAKPGPPPSDRDRLMLPGNKQLK